MMRAVAFVTLLFAAAIAQDPPVDAPPVGGAEAGIMAVVASEQMMARYWLDLILRMQHAGSSMQAGQQFLMQTMEFETEDVDIDVKLELMASLSLFTATKIKLYQTIYAASDLQQEYYFNRYMMYLAGAAGASAVPQVYQFMYLKSFAVFLKTYRLSLALQTIAHFTTWMEHSIDANTLDLADDEGESVSNGEIADMMRDDMIRDRMFAFSAYQQYAMIDFYLFYIEIYLEYAEAAFAGPPVTVQAKNAASFLEEEIAEKPVESTTESQSQSEFMPYMYFTQPMLYMRIYKFYYLMFTMMGAHGGLMSAFLENQALENDLDGDVTNDDEADQQLEQADQAFNMYAYSLVMAGQLEYFTAIYQLWGMFMMMSMGQQMAGGAVPPPPEAPAPEEAPAAHN